MPTEYSTKGSTSHFVARTSIPPRTLATVQRGALNRLLLGLSLTGALLLGSGCASLTAPGSPVVSREEPEYREWLELVDTSSRSFELTHQLDTRLIGRATLLTPAVREAYAKEYVRMYHLPEGEASRVYAFERKKSEESLEVLVWVTAKESKLASLEEKDKLWKVTFRTGDGELVSPQSIEWYKKPDRVATYFYPHLDTLGRTYRLNFPVRGSSGKLLTESGPLTLMFAGVQGYVELTWDMGVASSR